MKISVPLYQSGYKVVSIALDEQTKDDLLSEDVKFWYVCGDKITEYPEENFITNAETVISDFMSCHNYDVFEIGENGTAFRCYDNSSTENLFFVTGKCNSNCIICPSPEYMRRKGEPANIDSLIDIAGHIPANAPHITITGGEPFLAGKDIFRLLSCCKEKFIGTEFLILTNGRVFSIREYSKLLCETVPENTYIGIPIHGATPEIHDLITQAPGSFHQTLAGLKRLYKLGLKLELRIVVCRTNVSNIEDIAKLIIRELPNTDRVCIMAMEMTGNAFKNRDEIWIPYSDSFPNVKKAIDILVFEGINVQLFNYPLCTVDKRYWSLCAKSISGYKVRYGENCCQCAVKDSCGGVFAGTLLLERADLNPVII